MPILVSDGRDIIELMPEFRIVLDECFLFPDKRFTKCLYRELHHRFALLGLHDKVGIGKDLLAKLGRNLFVIGHHLCREESVELCSIVEHRLTDI